MIERTTTIKSEAEDPFLLKGRFRYWQDGHEKLKASETIFIERIKLLALEKIREFNGRNNKFILIEDQVIVSWNSGYIFGRWTGKMDILALKVGYNKGYSMEDKPEIAEKDKKKSMERELEDFRIALQRYLMDELQGEDDQISLVFSPNCLIEEVKKEII